MCMENVFFLLVEINVMWLGRRKTKNHFLLIFQIKYILVCHLSAENEEEEEETYIYK